MEDVISFLRFLSIELLFLYLTIMSFKIPLFIYWSYKDGKFNNSNN